MRFISVANLISPRCTENVGGPHVVAAAAHETLTLLNAMNVLWKGRATMRVPLSARRAFRPQMRRAVLKWNAAQSGAAAHRSRQCSTVVSLTGAFTLGPPMNPVASASNVGRRHVVAVVVGSVVKILCGSKKFELFDLNERHTVVGEPRMHRFVAHRLEPMAGWTGRALSCRSGSRSPCCCIHSSSTARSWLRRDTRSVPFATLADAARFLSSLGSAARS